MDRGDLVPDDVVIGMVQSRLAQEDARTKGWLLDGYPRSAAQGAALAAAGVAPQAFLLLDVPDEVLIERVVGRRLDPDTGKIYHVQFAPPPPGEVAARCVTRSDDTEEKARNRLGVFAANVEAVKGLYAGCLVAVDGNRDKEAVFADVEKAIEAAKGK
jgi:adenylate kinase